jgi:predicted RNA polymerase sigma factor
VPQARQDSGGSAYEKALALTQQEPARQFLAKRLEELK